ncbi:phosphoglycerate transporter protein [Klebsiella pneumoniae]|nr:phosphoglycerate transporter protein [Klebsiella pneumoniae]
MLSLLKKGPSANKVPAEKIQATYGRYRMQALLSVFLGYLAYYIVRNNFTLSTPYLKEQLDLSARRSVCSAAVCSSPTGSVKA